MLVSPLLNRGTAFSHAERAEYCLEGLLPAGVSDMAGQVVRAYATLGNLHEPLAKYRELAALQDRNEYLFYRVLLDHLAEFLPIVYTPTVGEAAQKFSDVFQRGRGIWITPAYKGRMREVLAVALEGRDIRLMVVTDNESILGLGDQGAGGMTISIGKLALYTACAGVAPESTLPVSLDFGTNNVDLLENPYYLGWPERRMQGEAYDELVEEFVVAVQSLYPRALIQWEDFRKDNALNILDRYRHRVLSFNDDIEGTGAVTLAGIYSALRICEQSLEDQRIVILGAGAAGLGIARQIKSGLQDAGVADADMQKHVAVLDSAGLIVNDNEYRDAYKAELAWTTDWAKQVGVLESRDLGSVVDAFAATILVGTSGQAGIFTEEIVRSMANNAQQPIILPLSNPTANSEATPEHILEWTEGRALVATGSPFVPVHRDGRVHHIGQGNNVFIFPSLGLGALLAEATEVTTTMIGRASSALAEAMLPGELDRGLLYPDVERLREVSAQITTAVVEQAVKDGVATANLPADLGEYVAQSMWVPEYR
jgi:malic enzyme